MLAAPPKVMLCADDFALSEGVSRGVMELADRGRLSATGAMVNTRHWARSAAQVGSLRKKLALGLHLNLTLGQPLGEMPGVAPAGVLPSVDTLIKATLRGQLSAKEVGGEIDRQLDQFEQVAGAPPDFIDGHHHVHVLKPVRQALSQAVVRRYGKVAPLIRTPTDHWLRILRRSGVGKALIVAWLGGGARRELARADIPTNDGFSGFSAFSDHTPFDLELDGFLRARGPRHMIMCHPGYPDEELKALDPVGERRLAEFNAIATRPDLADWLWRPARQTDGRIDWEGFGHG